MFLSGHYDPVRRVFVEGWQFACCGDAFGVGSQVDWRVGPLTDDEYLVAVLGGDDAGQVTDIEDHHDVLDGPTEALAGTVQWIGAVFCAYALPSPSAKALYPVSGTGSVETIEHVDGIEPRDRDDREFVGYLVDIDAA